MMGPTAADAYASEITIVRGIQLQSLALSPCVGGVLVAVRRRLILVGSDWRTG